MPKAFKKILVTGAEGFIGSHVTEQLVAAGYAVKAFVLYNSFNSWGWLDHSPVKDAVEIFLGDVRDPNGVMTAARDCDAILHLAALIGIPFSYHSPDTYIDTNIKGTLNIVQAARALNIKKVVITSTSEVYGSAQFVPMTEAHPLQGQSPYSASKIGADQLAMSFHTSFDTPVAIIRPFNTFGPRQSARAVIPTIITQIASGAREIKLGALHPTRDFTFVDDTARAFLAVLEADAAIGEVINIGSNFEISMQATAALIAEVLNKEVTFVSDEDRLRPNKSEVTRLWADTTKARKLLNWQPTFAGKSGFAAAMRLTCDWFLHGQHLNYYKPQLYAL